MHISNYLANALLNAIFCGGSYTFPSTVYVSLYTSDPTGADTGNEASGGAYAREVADFTVPALENGKMTIKNEAEIQFDIATSDWGTITHVGIRDAATGGNLLYYGELTDPRTILAGDRINFAANSIVCTLS